MMHVTATAPLVVFEVRHLDDIRTLQSLTQSDWHPAADALDAWCSDHNRSDQRVLDSYITTGQLARMLGRIVECPINFPNHRIYCSADPDLKHITGIAITHLSGDTCTIEFAVSHPENIPVSGHQAKARTGSVAVLLQHVVTTCAQYSAFYVDATASGQRLFERVGFVAVNATPSARCLTPMMLTQDKTHSLLTSLTFSYQSVELPCQLADWTAKNK